MSRYSKKHYEETALVLSSVKADTFDIRSSEYTLGAETALRRVVRLLANLFEDDNPRFDREKFIEACK